MVEDGKIEAMNSGLRALIATLSHRFGRQATVACISFGGAGARLHLDPVPAPDADWPDVEPGGGTPLGAALRLVADTLDRPDFSGPDGLRPVLLLASDGRPTDSWRRDLAGLAVHARGRSSERWALALGADADLEMLDEFATTPWMPGAKLHGVFSAGTAPEIVSALRLLSLRLEPPLWREGEEPQEDSEPWEP